MGTLAVSAAAHSQSPSTTSAVVSVSRPLPHDIVQRFALTSSNAPPYHPSRSTDHVANIVGLFRFLPLRGCVVLHARLSQFPIPRRVTL
jgi:hypothetical protein